MSTLPCEDYSQFKQALIKLRKLDDLIVNRLNTTIPTDTFKNAQSVERKNEQCDTFYKQLQEAYSDRRAAINKCLQRVESDIDGLRAQRAKNRDDDSVAEKLSDASTKLRLMKLELPIEDVIEERSMKTFKERCNTYEMLG